MSDTGDGSVRDGLGPADAASGLPILGPFARRGGSGVRIRAADRDDALADAGMCRAMDRTSLPDPATALPAGQRRSRQRRLRGCRSNTWRVTGEATRGRSGTAWTR